MIWILAGILTVIAVELSRLVLQDYKPQEERGHSKRGGLFWFLAGVITVILARFALRHYEPENKPKRKKHHRK